MKSRYWQSTRTQWRLLILLLNILLLLLLNPSTVWAADGALPFFETLTGNYCLRSAGVGLQNGGKPSLQMDVAGTPVRAYLYWSGRYVGLNNGDDTIRMTVNGSAPTTIKATYADSAYAGYAKRYYYSYRSADLVTAGLLTSSGLNVITLAGLKTDEAEGAVLVVIYASPACAASEIKLAAGLDGFYWNFPAPAGGNTQATCTTFAPAVEARTLELNMIVGGTEGRANRIWYATGADAAPSDLIQSGLGMVLAGPLPPATNPPYPLTGEAGDFTNFTATIAVPGGKSWACFQIESIANDGTGINGTSGVWLGLVSRIPLPLPTPTSTDTPTVTPTATPTPTTTPTATPTLTPAPTATDVPAPTLTIAPPTVMTPDPLPEDTPTPTSTATQTATPTFTATSSPTPTATVTATNTPTPEATVQGTYERASLDLRKYTNGDDADLPPGPQLQVGDPVTWTYIVRNTGEISLTHVGVTDDHGVLVTCPQSQLPPGATMLCTGHGLAEPGQYINVGTAIGQTPQGFVIKAQNQSHYFASVLSPDQPATVGDRVWLDINKDGVQDPAEPGLPGIILNLFTPNGLLVEQVVTNDQGIYTIDDLPPGSYYLAINALPTYVPSPLDRSSDDLADSDLNPGTLQTSLFTLLNGQVDTSRDIGLYQNPTALNEEAEPVLGTAMQQVFLPLVRK